MSAAGGEDVDGGRGMHRTSRNNMKREQTHISAICGGEGNFLAGFKVEGFFVDDDATLILISLAHIESCRRVALRASRQLLNALQQRTRPFSKDAALGSFRNCRKRNCRHPTLLKFCLGPKPEVLTISN